MADPELLHDDLASAAHDDAPSRAPDPRLLARLNRRGLRLVMLADATALLAVMVGMMLLRYGLPPWPQYPTWLYLVSFAVVLTIFLASLYFGGLYEREPRLGAAPVLPRVARQTLAAGGLVALLNLGLTGAAREVGLTTARALPFPFINLGVLIVVGAVAVAANRGMVLWLRTRREGPPRVLLVGRAEDRVTAREHLAADDRRARIVGEIADPSLLLERVSDDAVTDVVLLERDLVDPLFPSSIEALGRAGVTVLVRVTARETMFGLERVREVGGIPFVVLRAQTIQRSRVQFKRLNELAIFAVFIPVVLPLVALVTLYQLIAVGRPLLFWQERVGVDGRSFQMVKFRTMELDAEARGGPQLAEQDDPRVVPACRWVRATRFDELPQLYNVLRGEMSLVGPRPERPELTERFEQEIEGYARRHELPPGMTGLAQIHGRYHTDAEYKLGYDLQYLVNWSPVLDIQILLRTVWVVLARRL